MKRRRWNVILLIAIGLSIVVSLFADSEWNICLICRCISLVLIAVLAFVNFGWDKLKWYFVSQIKKKEDCPCYSKEDCPYGELEECAYDTSNCRVFAKDKKAYRKTTLIIVLFMISLVITIFGELAMGEDGFLKSLEEAWNLKMVLRILQPIVNSFIAAVFVSYVIDIPTRMKEYQSYFVELLSSSDYLKKMTETELTKLRKEVTWLLHIKDFPHMPKKLIDMDENFCNMLKKPFYKEYSQTVSLERNGPDTLVKTVNIEYIAFNPQHKSHAIEMDISFSNSLKFEGEINKDTAKDMFKLNKLICTIDDREQEFNLLPFVRIGVTKEKKDGQMYNGRIVLMPKDAITNKDMPLSMSGIETGSNQNAEVLYDDSIEESGKAHLFLSFCDKLKVRMQYVVSVPETDTSYTKRLRYPAKYFHLDYSLGASVANYTLVGQILGTLIDQPDVSIELSENQKRVSMRTHNWLLPKNGAVIVHCKA